MGSVSAAMTTNSEIPRFSVLVATQSVVCFRKGFYETEAKLKRHYKRLTFISAFAQLLVVGSLLHDVEDSVCQLHEQTHSRMSTMLRQCVHNLSNDPNLTVASANG